MTMPQSERSNILKELLKWISSQENGATLAAIHAQVRNEITQLGATAKTIESYVYELHRASFIEYKPPYWRITKSGKEWLERHTV